MRRRLKRPDARFRGPTMKLSTGERPLARAPFQAVPPACGLFGAPLPDPEARARQVLAGLGMSTDEWSRRFGAQDRSR
jgi:hypothetical protein